ncbi:hypothetical protein GK047_11690 [Paenibacillus sp. SYP-B3998]|uniref:Uncharacterized protein n=1 Tax=Paenibacillus sp. SYP-B3998 TaxID=2678564 RepID=A0A6G3ZWS9_9BACL|nr:hypothetical protein [Paenibacillus sp. SYP-B3998]NEW06676.1 hypothetical protein [Paenibacillus sp. SYP-B3998]
MNNFGVIICIVLVFVVTLYLGPLGVLFLLASSFALICSNYLRNKAIHSDLQKIKEKLGIVEKDEFNLTNAEIEQELEAYTAGQDRDETKSRHEKNE